MTKAQTQFAETLAVYSAKYVISGHSIEEAMKKGFADMQAFNQEMIDQKTERSQIMLARIKKRLSN